MLSIIIVEDNDSLREQMGEAIKDYALIEGFDIQLALITADPYECIEHLEKHPDMMGLYFLDVNLENEMDGMELGGQIKKLDPNGRIVMVTKDETLAYFTFVYKLEVLDYIVKNSIEEVITKVRKCVKIAYERYMVIDTTKRRRVDVKIGSRIRSIPMEEVCFIETSGQEHRLILHTLNSRIEFRGCIRECENNNPGLLRTHRAYLVNMDNAKMFDEESRKLKMANGEFCYVAMRKKKAIKAMLKTKENDEERSAF